MHAAKLENSERLQRALGVLVAIRRADTSGGWITTRTLIRRAHVCAVNSVIAELRENGVEIEARQRVVGGQRRWAYRVNKVPAWWVGAAASQTAPVALRGANG